MSGLAPKVAVPLRPAIHLVANSSSVTTKFLPRASTRASLDAPARHRLKIIDAQLTVAISPLWESPRISRDRRCAAIPRQTPPDFRRDHAVNCLWFADVQPENPLPSRRFPRQKASTLHPSGFLIRCTKKLVTSLSSLEFFGHLVYPLIRMLSAQPSAENRAPVSPR